MKVRFYRGPYDGKKMDIDPNQITSGVRITYSRKRTSKEMAKIRETRQTTLMDWHVYGQTSYSIRMMTVDMNGLRYYAPAMHPDGSIIMEWDERRGKRA